VHPKYEIAVVPTRRLLLLQNYCSNFVTNFYLVVDSVTGLRSQKLITKIDHKRTDSQVV